MSDEASLHAAVAAAQTGDVIAVQGTIELHTGALMETSEVTLTCATPGSGLAFATAGVADDFTLVYALADRVVVRGLVLDASRGQLAVYSQFTDGHRTEGNTISCGDTCGFWVGTTNAVVSDNVATQAVRGSTGFHFQSGIDGTRIERNALTAFVPTAAPVFGAIRPRDGAGVTVSSNVVRGPWSNSISSVNLNDSDLSHNVLEGAQRYGLAVNVVGSPNVIFSSRNRFIENIVRDAGISGFNVRNACSNMFLANRTLGTTAVAFILETTTGDNLIAGPTGLVVDHGAFDCDGDGINDPNTVAGKATVTTSITAAVIGTSLSLRIDGAASATASARRLQIPEKQ